MAHSRLTAASSQPRLAWSCALRNYRRVLMRTWKSEAGGTDVPSSGSS